jgi:hypothetical protein
LSDANAGASAKILQLYPRLELYQAGEPSINTLFILGRPPLAVMSAQDADQLLLIDPPADASHRFRLPTNLATLFTGAPIETGLPQIQTTPGGVAHIRIGEHLLDVYSQHGGNVIHLPALGILCGGAYGSDLLLPELGPNSDGGEELDTLRLLARLAKAGRLQLYIPRAGPLADNPAEILRRLANDVAYLHNLRRVVPALSARGDNLESAPEVVRSLLPAERCSPLTQVIHESNVRLLLTHAQV